MAETDTKMDTELRSVLNKQGFHADMVTFLEGLGCLTLPVFAQWLDEPKEWTALVAKSPRKEDPSEAPKLKAVWARARTISQRRDNREADGLPAEEMDDRLPIHVHKDLIAHAAAYYRWPRFDSFSIAADGIIGRFTREFKVFQPSNYPVRQIRSLGDHSSNAEYDLWIWAERMNITAVSWAVTGCFEVEVVEKGTSVKSQAIYCHWAEAAEYVAIFTCKVPRLENQFTDASVLAYLEEAQELFWAKAIDLARGAERVPFGQVLLLVLQCESAIWQARDTLVPSGGSAPRQQSRGQMLKGGGSTERERTPRGNASRQPTFKEVARAIKTSITAPDGRRICKPFNDNRGCSKKDRCDKSHCCDALVNGRVCGKSHSRLFHDAQRHGKVEPR